ncbi:EAL domain-containing protein [Azospirillum sp. TSO22-1]|uniref:putative bifunctional diguanylate cyclase/phosphodiesterase n=1 Tax=Azospirillum sp. TSO22-1 TaxID=716789 RepID=UPI000D653A94|nr:EAL domain-containing protein [Azospirillum sp. TSO22-1]
MSGHAEDQSIMAAAVAAAGDVGYCWDFAADTITWAGDARCLFGGDPVGNGEELRRCIRDDDRARRRRVLSRHIDHDTPFDVDYRLRLADGAQRWVHDRGRVERAADGTPVRLYGMLRTIDGRKAYEVELEQQAHFDPMTGLVNLNRLRDSLHQALVAAGRFERSAVYLAVGIDKLGLVNEALGHAAADAVVVEVARRLAAVVRPGDTVGRGGGDIFGVVLPHCPEEHMPAVAEKLLAAVRAGPIASPAGPIHATVSVGGIVAGRDAGSVEEAMTRADTALHEAKRQGRDCFWPHHATSLQQSALRASLAIGQRVKAALMSDSLRFAFQPVVDSSGGVDFFECLLRMDGDGGSVLPAGQFVPAVERLGMARRVDHHTLGMALRELRAHDEVQLSLNVSAETTGDRTWLAALQGMLADRPEIASRLIVEITETAVIEDLDEAARFVAAVRTMGCRVALDDFGAGYISYQHLRALPVDIVKIDGAFVRDMHDSAEALLFIRTLVGLARGFGLTTVAECVEDETQATALRREGVRLLQGWHFGRPSLERPWLGAVEPLAAD